MKKQCFVDSYEHVHGWTSGLIVQKWNCVDAACSKTKQCEHRCCCSFFFSRFCTTAPKPGGRWSSTGECRRGRTSFGSSACTRTCTTARSACWSSWSGRTTGFSRVFSCNRDLQCFHWLVGTTKALIVVTHCHMKWNGHVTSHVTSADMWIRKKCFRDTFAMYFNTETPELTRTLQSLWTASFHYQFYFAILRFCATLQVIEMLLLSDSWSSLLLTGLYFANKGKKHDRSSLSLHIYITPVF